MLLSLRPSTPMPLSLLAFTPLAPPVPLAPTTGVPRVFLVNEPGPSTRAVLPLVSCAAPAATVASPSPRVRSLRRLRLPVERRGGSPDWVSVVGGGALVGVSLCRVISLSSNTSVEFQKRGHWPTCLPAGGRWVPGGDDLVCAFDQPSRAGSRLLDNSM